MTNFEAFAAFATTIESNPRYTELTEKRENLTITPEESAELDKIVDVTFFDPFMIKNFRAIDEKDSPEEKDRIKAKVQDLIDRGVIG